MRIQAAVSVKPPCDVPSQVRNILVAHSSADTLVFHFPPRTQTSQPTPTLTHADELSRSAEIYHIRAIDYRVTI